VWALVLLICTAKLNHAQRDYANFTRSQSENEREGEWPVLQPANRISDISRREAHASRSRLAFEVAGLHCDARSRFGFCSVESTYLVSAKQVLALDESLF
jgi:hypothetical protein